MPEPLEHWKITAIEEMTAGERVQCDSFFVCRYKDGWHFMWSNPVGNGQRCQDLGRFFDTDHKFEMRNFMAGKWDLGVPIPCPNVYE